MNGRLFGDAHDARLDHYLDGAKGTLDRRVSEVGEEELLAADELELAERLAEPYSIEPLVVRFEERHSTGQREVTEMEPGPLDPEKLYPREGIETTMAIPFAGDAALFDRCPTSMLPSWYPYGTIIGQEIHSSYVIRGGDHEELKRQMDRNEHMLKDFTERMIPEVEAHNGSLVPRALGNIRARKKRILDGRAMLASLKIPIERRAGAPATYAPAIRKRVKPQPAAPRSGTFTPEPELEQEVFDGMIEVIQTMGQALERSPSTFGDLGEEDLRNFILVLLNSHYKEAGTTAETFNRAGKTDILIRHDGKNIFIAECKKWDGPKTVTKALDQLLTYLCWRDTKAALILFSDRRDFSDVVAKVKETVPQHPGHMRTEDPKGETEFRYTFRHENESEPRIRLAVLVFHVPAEPPTAAE